MSALGSLAEVKALHFDVRFTLKSNIKPDFKFAVRRIVRNFLTRQFSTKGRFGGAESSIASE
jgi:hypothetical protein